MYNHQGVKKNTLQYIEVTMAEKNLEISVLCDIYSSLLPEKQRMALEYYYNDDLSLSEIAEKCGYSDSSALLHAINNEWKKAVKKLT